MIVCTLFEVASEGGSGILSKWLKKHEAHRGPTLNRLFQLRLYGVGAEETLRWCDHESDGIWKLKVRTKPPFRPHLCRGPFSMRDEATFLETAIEQDFALVPVDVKDRAIKRREQLIKDPRLRIELTI